MNNTNNIEVEIRGLLTEEQYARIISFLDKNAEEKEVDDRKTIFFMIPDKTLKVTNYLGKGKAKIALKVGHFVTEISQKEYELYIGPDQFDIAIEIFKNLGFDKTQNTEQKRINYKYRNCEIAIKWSLDWGYHFEMEKVIGASENQAQVREELISIASELGLKIMSDQQFAKFVEEIDKKHNPS